jgi:hypothetical protein
LALALLATVLLAAVDELPVVVPTLRECVPPHALSTARAAIGKKNLTKRITKITPGRPGLFPETVQNSKTFAGRRMTHEAAMADR